MALNLGPSYGAGGMAQGLDDIIKQRFLERQQAFNEAQLLAQMQRQSQADARQAQQDTIAREMSARKLSMENATMLEGVPGANIPVGMREGPASTGGAPITDVGASVSMQGGPMAVGWDMTANKPQAFPSSVSLRPINQESQNRIKAQPIPGVPSLGVSGGTMRPRTSEELTAAKQQEALSEPYNLGAGQGRFIGGEMIGSMPSAPRSPQRPIEGVVNGKPSFFVMGDDGQPQVVQGASPMPKASGSSGTDANMAKEIADAIENGLQPPEMKGLYRYGAAVRAELGKRGYDLKTAQLDYGAMQRRLASLNSTQQTRLRQAAQTAYESLDVIDELANKWQGGRFPVLNRVGLAAAKNGLMGPEAQAIATQLEAQITDVVSELSNVYMGGNSPTDHALQLASKNLSSNWSLQQLLAGTKLARQNLRIRLNSMDSMEAATLGKSSEPPPNPAPNNDPLGIRR